MGSLMYTPGWNRPVVMTSERDICALRSDASAWDCYAGADGPDTGDFRMPIAVAHNPVNDRILWIGSTWGGWGDPEENADETWQLDLSTGVWTELYPASN